MRWILFRSDDAGCSNPFLIIRVGEDESALSWSQYSSPIYDGDVRSTALGWVLDVGDGVRIGKRQPNSQVIQLGVLSPRSEAERAQSIAYHSFESD